MQDDKITKVILSESDKIIDPILIFKESRINLSVSPPFPPIALSLGYGTTYYNNEKMLLRFGTYGNISLIKGEEKSRKSFLRTVIEYSYLGGNSILKSHHSQDKMLISIDTEQGEFDSWHSADRVAKIVGIDENRHLSFHLRPYNPIERVQFLEWICLESEYKKRIGLLMIDGFVDLLYDSNDLSQCVELMSKLLKWSEKTKAHISGILHVNPGSSKGRGHLGTILQQKAETVVLIKEIEGTKESLLTCQRARGEKFPDMILYIEGVAPYLKYSENSKLEIEKHWFDDI